MGEHLLRKHLLDKHTIDSQEKQSPEKNWLSLGQTAQLLGVHPVTLRRWADAGDIGYMLTAGGHRRFAMSEVKRFAVERQRSNAVPQTEQVWADHALIHSQQVIQSHRHAQWIEAFDEQERERSRALGRRLMAILLQYISCNENGGLLLDEARAIGEQYALGAIAHGMTLTTVLEVTMYFRDAMFEAAILVPEVTRTSSETSVRLLKRINALLNAVQLSVANAYDTSGKR